MLVASRYGVFLFVFLSFLFVSHEVRPQSLDPNSLLGVVEELLKLEQQNNQRKRPSNTAKTPASNFDQTANTVERQRIRKETRQIQAALNFLGYDAGPVDGVPGRRTRAALAAFERDYGFQVDGAPDPEVLGALKFAERNQETAPNNINSVPGIQTSLGSGGEGPSFPCEKARTVVEKAICASAALSFLDRSMADEYRAALSSELPNARTALKRAQRDWLRRRDACGPDHVCLSRVISERLNELNAIGGGVVESPAIRITEQVPMMPGLRQPAPVMFGERVLTGYPIMRGDYNQDSVEIDGRAYSKANLDLAILLDLYTLRAIPGVLQEKQFVLRYASRFLTGDLRDKYYAVCNRPCNSGSSSVGWKGTNEFERAENYEGFMSEIVPQLAQAGRAAPLLTVEVQLVEIGQYDTGRQAFPLIEKFRRGGFLGNVATVRNTTITPDIAAPADLPMDPEAAQSFVEQFQGANRIAYLAYEQELGVPEMGAHMVEIPVRTTRIRLYADPQLQELFHDFGGMEAPLAELEPTVSMRSGLVWVGNRVAALAGPVQIETPAPLGINLAQAFKASLGSEIEDSYLDDQTVLNYFKKLHLEDREEVSATALKRPLDRAELMHVRAGLHNMLFRDPFVRKRAVDAIRQKMIIRTPQTQLPQLSQPVPIRAYCPIRFLDYDFTSSAFPLELDCSSLGTSGLQIDVTNKDITLTVNPVPAHTSTILTSLPVELDKAEAYQSELKKVFIASFETAMTVTSRKTEAGLVASVSFAPSSNLVAHKGNSLTEIAFPLDTSQAAIPELTSDNTQRIWSARNPQHMLELAGLAGDAKSLPFDGRTLVGSGGETLGKIIVESNSFNLSNVAQVDNSRTVGLFASQGMAGTRRDDALFNALHIPAEQLATLPVYFARGEISVIYAVFPDSQERYSIPVPNDFYGLNALATQTVLDVKAVHKFDRTLDGPPVLVVIADPIEGRLTDPARDNIVIERFEFRREPKPATYEILNFPPRYELLSAIGTAYGVDPRPILEYRIEQPKGLSSFEQQKRLDVVLELADAVASDGITDYWLGGTVRVMEYDYATQSFPISKTFLKQPNMMRDPEVTVGAISTDILNREVLTISVPPEQAEEFSKRINPPVVLPFRLLVQPRHAVQSSYGNLRVSAAAIYGELLDENAVLSIKDPSKVLYRIGTPPKAKAPGDVSTRKGMSREEAIAFLDEAIEKSERFILVGHNGTSEISEVLTNYHKTRDYVQIVKDQALDMPDIPVYGHGIELGEKFRNNPNAVFWLVPRALKERSASQGQGDGMREVLIALAQEFDLEIESFPPKPESIVSTGKTSLEDLLAGGPQYVVIRRREDTGPITSAYTSQTDSYFYDGGLRESGGSRYNSDEMGFVFQSDLPEQSSKIDLLEIPDKLRLESNSAVILSSESLRKIFNKISDMDLVGRRFPLEKIHVGIPKDHKQTAEHYSVLDVKGGLERQMVAVILKAEFGQDVHEDLQTGEIYAGGEACVGNVVPRAGEIEEAGTRCARAKFEGNVISSISLRQVVEGNVEQAVLEALIERYGRNPFMKEIRYLEAGGTRLSQGWGDIIPAERETLGRADVKLPPAVVEANVWVQNGVTTVFVQLDNLPTVEEEKAAATPKIEF